MWSGCLTCKENRCLPKQETISVLCLKCTFFPLVPWQNGYIWNQDLGCNQIKIGVICIHLSQSHEKERCRCSDMPSKHEAATHKPLSEAWNWAFPWPEGSNLINTSISAFCFQSNDMTCYCYLSHPHLSILILFTAALGNLCMPEDFHFYLIGQKYTLDHF